MKKIISFILMLSAVLTVCSCNRGLPDNSYTTEQNTDEPETETEAQTGIDPSLLAVTPWLDGNRDDVLGITWYYDADLKRTLYDNLVYIYIGVYDNGDYTLHLRMQYYGQKVMNTERFMIIADGTSYTVSTTDRLDTGVNGTYVWEYTDVIPRKNELDAVAAYADANVVDIRVYNESNYIERTADDSEKSSLERMYKLYRALTGEETGYKVETIADTAVTTGGITALDELITTTDGVSTLTYDGYCIKFPAGYSCTADESGKVTIAKRINDGEAVTVEVHNKPVYIQSVTDDVVKSTLQTFKSNLGEGTAEVYGEAEHITLGGKPAAKYVYKVEFDTCSVYVTVYIIQSGAKTYTVSVSELNYGGTVLLPVASTLTFDNG